MSVVETRLELLDPAVADSQPIDGAPTGAAPSEAQTDAQTDAGYYARFAMLLLLLATVPRAVTFLRGILFYRWMQPYEAGKWDLSYSFLMLAAPLAVIGIPGSFGRYVERYRAAGQLRTFLRRTLLATAIVGAVVAAVFAFERELLADRLFGSGGYARLALWLAMALCATILYNTLTSLFLALHLMRAAFVLQLSQTVLFTAIAAWLLLSGEPLASEALEAFTAACVLAALISAPWLIGMWRQLPVVERPTPAGSFWPGLMRYAVWIWIGNMIVNCYEIADRILIVQVSDLPPEEAMRLVGQYSSARVIPLFFVTLSAFIGPLLLPRFARLWEAGRRDEVSRRLNMTLKAQAFLFFCAAVAVMFAAPLLFEGVFQGKYELGQPLLAWTLSFCIWSSLAYVAENYLFCGERAGRVCVVFLTGLAVNVALGMALVPILGVYGAAWGTCAGNLFVLLGIYLLSWRAGFTFDGATPLLSLLPLSLFLGPWAGLAAIVAALAAGRWLLREHERQVLREIADFVRRRLGWA